MHTVGYVPARGGSRRLLGKNVMTVGGVPLVARAVHALHAAGVEDVWVGTDDGEIAAVARLAGARVHLRPGVDDRETVVDATARFVGSHSLHVDENVVVVLQPTMPCVDPSDVRLMVERCRETGDTVIAVTPHRHLLWDVRSMTQVGPRVNSTDDVEAAVQRECPLWVARADRVQEPFPYAAWTLAEVEPDTAVDVDTVEDLHRARRQAGGRRRVSLRYAFGPEIGSGHRYRCEALARELQHHDVEVVPYFGQRSMRSPDAVILDALDTTREQIAACRAEGASVVVTLEDRGDGCFAADLTVNELYSEATSTFHVEHGVHGTRYAVLRPEFCGLAVRDSYALHDPTRIVATFGGTDPQRWTEALVDALSGWPGKPLHVRVIVPPVAPLIEDRASLQTGSAFIEYVENPHMAEEFRWADLAVTSAGRTVHEAAACATPTISVPVNEREREHAVCPGVWFLTPRPSESHVRPADVVRAIEIAIEVDNEANRAADAAAAHAAVDGLGAQRIVYLLDGLLGGLL